MKGQGESRRDLFDKRVLESAIEDRAEKLEEAVEEYFANLLQDWLPTLADHIPAHVKLPPPEGIDLTPIVVQIGEWELRWPYLEGPATVLLRTVEDGPEQRERWWYTDLLYPLLLGGYSSGYWSSRFPKDLLPPGTLSGVYSIGKEKLAFLSPVVSDIHRYKERWVAQFLDLYDQVTRRYREAIPRVQEVSRRIFEEEREFVDRVVFIYTMQKMKDI